MLKVVQNCENEAFVLGSKTERRLAAKSAFDCDGCSIDETRVGPACASGSGSKSLLVSDADGASMLRLENN